MIIVLGKGGYAKVVLVRKNDDGSVWALKILKKKFIGIIIKFKNKKDKLSI
jgi:serum/glucocorticoid-regulated kinase 2